MYTNTKTCYSELSTSLSACHAILIRCRENQTVIGCYELGIVLLVVEPFLEGCHESSLRCWDIFNRWHVVVISINTVSSCAELSTRCHQMSRTVNMSGVNLCFKLLQTVNCLDALNVINTSETKQPKRG